MNEQNQPDTLSESKESLVNDPASVPFPIALRNRFGSPLRENKAIVLGTIVLILVINKIGLVLPFLDLVGSTLAVLTLWGLLWLQGSTWKDFGFKRPASWGKTISLGVIVAVLLQASALLITLPLFARLGIPTPDLSAYEGVKTSVFVFLGYLLVSWTTAAFFEEIIWRGFVMPQVAYLFDDSQGGQITGLLLSAVLFGLVHYPQGITGMVMTGFAGLVYGVITMKSKGNLWAAVIAHGMTDTIAFILLFYGGPLIRILGL